MEIKILSAYLTAFEMIGMINTIQFLLWKSKTIVRREWPAGRYLVSVNYVLTVPITALMKVWRLGLSSLQQSSFCRMADWIESDKVIEAEYKFSRFISSAGKQLHFPPWITHQINNLELCSIFVYILRSLHNKVHFSVYK